MKNLILLTSILVAWTLSLTAQTTREQADTIVINYLQNKNIDYTFLHVNLNEPNAAGITITTSKGETFTAKYACWAYYLNDSISLRCRYLFVKEDNGNLLEVIANNDYKEYDSTLWEIFKGNDPLSLVEGKENITYLLYPNPTTGQLTISLPNPSFGGAFEVENVEIYDIVGKCVQSAPFNSPEGGKLPSFGGAGGGEISIDISHLPNGMYILKIHDINKQISVFKILKN